MSGFQYEEYRNRPKLIEQVMRKEITPQQMGMRLQQLWDEAKGKWRN